MYLRSVQFRRRTKSGSVNAMLIADRDRKFRIPLSRSLQSPPQKVLELPLRVLLEYSRIQNPTTLGESDL